MRNPTIAATDDDDRPICPNCEAHLGWGEGISVDVTLPDGDEGVRVFCDARCREEYGDDDV